MTEVAQAITKQEMTSLEAKDVISEFHLLIFFYHFSVA